jgi:hypothetical protein
VISPKPNHRELLGPKNPDRGLHCDVGLQAKTGKAHKQAWQGGSGVRRDFRFAPKSAALPGFLDPVPLRRASLLARIILEWT